MLERVFGEVVVVRGTEARPPRDLLTLTLPGRPEAASAAAAGEQADDKPAADLEFDPLTRGPEITETR